MAVIYVPSSSGAATQLGMTSDTLYIISEGVRVTSSGAFAIIDSSFETGVGLIVAGEVASNFDTIRLFSDRVNAVVEATGRVVARTNAVMTLEGDGGVLVNYGNLLGLPSENNGSWAVYVSGSGNAVQNHGTVFAGATADRSHAVRLLSAENARLLNTGTLISSSADSATVDAELTSGTFRFDNSGQVLSAGLALELGAANTLVVNSGTILGTISSDLTQDGVARVVNSGLIDGDVFLGDLDDVYRGEGAGRVTGTVLGENGNDTLDGASADDTLDGGTGADILRGRGGEDVLYGGEGGDLLRGDEAADALYGGEDADVLRGGDGDDLVSGGSGDDVIYGDAGNDTLLGGGHRDLLFGGEGADVFVYSAANHSPNSTAFDTIRDFEDGDLIDLQTASAQVLAFRGTAGFSGGGVASLRYVVNAAGTAVVLADTDGDGAADMKIALIATPLLTADDFAL